MRISVYSENALVLRDGRPFGSMGSVQSTAEGGCPQSDDLWQKTIV